MDNIAPIDSRWEPLQKKKKKIYNKKKKIELISPPVLMI